MSSESIRDLLIVNDGTGEAVRSGIDMLGE